MVRKKSKKREVILTADKVLSRLQSGESVIIGSRAEGGNQSAMDVITTFVLYQRNAYNSESSKKLIDAYIRYKKNYQEHI